MPARRCALCGINYPIGLEFQRCPVHTEEPTDYHAHLEVDELWEWKSTTLLHRVRPTPESPIPYLRNVTISTNGNQLFITASDVVQAGLRRLLHAGDVLELEHELKTRKYSVLYEVMGRRESTREYWIRRLVVDPHEAGVTA